MIIAHNDEDVKEYMDIILSQNIENPVLIDKYLMGTEVEIDAICDGEEILIPGIMEHIERAGIHSGDSIAVYPAWSLSDEITKKIVDLSLIHIFKCVLKNIFKESIYIKFSIIQKGAKVFCTFAP